jgi:hypothetical protein
MIIGRVPDEIVSVFAVAEPPPTSPSVLKDQPCAAARFISFLRGEGGVIQANWCRFEDDKWQASDNLETLVWPKANLS